jgi:hypothetical protein
MAALAAACANRPDRIPSLDAIAEGYVRATLQLAQHQPELVEGWWGPPDWRPGPRQPVVEIRTRVRSLVSDLERIEASGDIEADPARLAYLRGQLAALDLVTRRLLGASTSFAEETRLAFVLGEPMRAAEDADTAKAALSRALPGQGAIRQRHEAFRRRFFIAPDRRERVLRAALDACRDAARTHVLLPDGEMVKLRFDVDSPWDGLARYDGHHRSIIEVSGRGELDVTRAVTLACHEGYPGHHLQHLLIQDALVRTRGWEEFQLAPRFGPHILVCEGAAEAGLDLAMPRDTRLHFYREQLLPLAGLPSESAEALVEVEERVRASDAAIPDTIAAYLDSRALRDETIEALSDLGVLDPESFLAFAERRRTLAAVYPIGRRLVERHVRAGGDPWARLVALFTSSPFALE